MRLKINIEKSIEKRRLIPTSWYVEFLDYFTYSLICCVFIICAIGPRIGETIKIDLTKIITIAFLLLFLILVIIALYRMSQLYVIDNRKLKLDKNFFKLLAKENEWTLTNEFEHVYLFNANHWFFHERQVTIIIINELIFINVMSFGQHDIKSPLYINQDRKILNKIIEKIKNNAA
jgi:hypothetical protein